MPDRSGLPQSRLVVDSDPDETQDWLSSLDSLIAHAGVKRAREILDRTPPTPPFTTQAD